MAGYPPALGCHRDDLQDRLKDKFPSKLSPFLLLQQSLISNIAL
jgi:hypothetical protein